MAALTGILRLIDRLWTALCRPLIIVLNMIFRPRSTDGAISKWKILLWLVANCVALGAVLVFASGYARAALFALLLLAHILIIFASLRVMSEERQVLEGSLAPEKMTFSVFDAVNNVLLLATSIIFYVLGLPVLLGVIEESGIARILTSKPVLPVPYLSNLACVLNEMPGVGPVINALANVAGLSKNLNAEIVYTGVIGNAARLFTALTVGYMVVRAIIYRVQQASHQRAIVRSVETGHTRWEAVEARLLRIPKGMAAKLHDFAAKHKDTDIRSRIEKTLARLSPHHRGSGG